MRIVVSNRSSGSLCYNPTEASVAPPVARDETTTPPTVRDATTMPPAAESTKPSSSEGWDVIHWEDQVQ